MGEVIVMPQREASIGRERLLEVRDQIPWILDADAHADDVFREVARRAHLGRNGRVRHVARTADERMDGPERHRDADQLRRGDDML